MSESAFIADVSAGNFATEVLARSEQVPVLVDFWAPWCGPCRSLGPLIERVVNDYRGGEYLAKVNTDEEQQLAGQFGIRSLPTVRLFRHGQAVDEFMGAQPEQVIRQMIERHIVRPSDAVRAEAETHAANGELAAAAELLRAALVQEPEHWPIHLQLIPYLLDLGELDEARSLFEALPRDVRDDDWAQAVATRISLNSRVEGTADRRQVESAVAADPGDLEARYQLSTLQVLAGEYEEAMEQLLEVLKRDRDFRDDAGRKGLIEVFNLLGNSGPLVKRYRRMMASAMH